MDELEVNHVDEIKDKLAQMVGERVKVKANMGRTRVIERMSLPRPRRLTCTSVFTRSETTGAIIASIRSWRRRAWQML